MEGSIAVSTVGYHSHVVKKGCSLPNALHFLANFKPRFSKCLSGSTERRLQSMLEEAYSNILPPHGERTENRAALRESSS